MNTITNLVKDFVGATVWWFFHNPRAVNRPEDPELPSALSVELEVDADAGTPPAQVEVDVELGRQEASTSAVLSDDVAPQIEQEEGNSLITSQSSTIKGNLMIGFALLNPSCTSFFVAGTLFHALYVGVTSLGIALSLFLCYAGGRMSTKVHDALLMVATSSLLGALFMLGVRASR